MLKVVKSRMVGYAKSVVEISNEHERLVDKRKRNIILPRNIKKGAFPTTENLFITRKTTSFLRTVPEPWS